MAICFVYCSTLQGPSVLKIINVKSSLIIYSIYHTYLIIIGTIRILSLTRTHQRNVRLWNLQQVAVGVEFTRIEKSKTFTK